MRAHRVELRGWVSNRRDSKGLVFIVLRDGTDSHSAWSMRSRLGLSSSRRPNVWD